MDQEAASRSCFATEEIERLRTGLLPRLDRLFNERKKIQKRLEGLLRQIQWTLVVAGLALAGVAVYLLVAKDSVALAVAFILGAAVLAAGGPAITYVWLGAQSSCDDELIGVQAGVEANDRLLFNECLGALKCYSKFRGLYDDIQQRVSGAKEHINLPG